MYYLTKVTTANKYIRKETVKVKSTNAFLKALVWFQYRELVNNTIIKIVEIYLILHYKTIAYADFDNWLQRKEEEKRNIVTKK